MSLWSALFGGKKPAVETEDKALFANEKSEELFSLPETDFVGWSVRSRNERWTVAWQDGGPDQSRKGQWLVLDGEKVVARGTMPRPNDGKVCDSGVFILNDWSGIEALSGTLQAFRSDGSVILARKFSANLYNNGLSADGRLAVCQTLNAPSEDSTKLFVFDLETKTELCSWFAESGLASTYFFSSDGQTITLDYGKRGAFRYSINGEFLDRSLWLSAGLRDGDLNVVRMLLAEVDGKPSPELVKLLLPAIDVGIKQLNQVQESMKAWALRLRGECLEATGDVEGALAVYTQALALDPKVGVKRKAEKLRKRAAG